MFENLIFTVNFNAIEYSLYFITIYVISSLCQNPLPGLTLSVTPHPVKLASMYMVRYGSVVVRYLQACSILLTHHWISLESVKYVS